MTTQLKEQIRWLVALGELVPGDRLPTVNELAERLRINSNTMAQAYNELGQEGYLAARPRQGTFVADSEAVRRAIQGAALGRIVDQALKKALEMGFTPDHFLEAAAARARIQSALSQRRTAIFVECNWVEIDNHSRTLHEEVGIAVTGVHLDRKSVV